MLLPTSPNDDSQYNNVFGQINILNNLKLKKRCGKWKIFERCVVHSSKQLYSVTVEVLPLTNLDLKQLIGIRWMC